MEKEPVRLRERPQGLRINGLAIRETLAGGAGSDIIKSGGGADILIGDMGNDIYYLHGGETVIEQPGGGVDVIRTYSSFTLSLNVEQLVLMGSDPISGTGNNGDNLIVGNAGNNTLVGLGGNDTLIGGSGDDVVVYNHPRRMARLDAFMDGAWRVIGPAGIDRLVGVERVRFSDAEVRIDPILALIR